MQIAWATNSHELEVRSLRKELSIKPVFKTVDTCAAEFASNTPYHYSTYERPIYKINSESTDRIDIQNEVS